jgi:uncharacterized membrane protein
VKKGRVEAFTDAVIAIVMTILVLELPEPHGETFISLFDNREKIVTYFISFIILAIYWNSHHHLFQVIRKVNGSVLWANNFFLLALSLFPYSTQWVGDHLFSRDPQIFYGLIILGADVAFYCLIRRLIKVNGDNSHIVELFSDSKKMRYTICLNIVGIIFGLFVPILTMMFNICMILFWVIPDKKIEHAIKKQEENKSEAGK